MSSTVVERIMVDVTGHIRWLAENIDCKLLLPCRIALSCDPAAPNVSSTASMTGLSCPNGDCSNLQPPGQPLWTTSTVGVIITLIPLCSSHITYKGSGEFIAHAEYAEVSEREGESKREIRVPR